MKAYNSIADCKRIITAFDLIATGKNPVYKGRMETDTEFANVVRTALDQQREELLYLIGMRGGIDITNHNSIQTCRKG